jgi:hypothetical protein
VHVLAEYVEGALLIASPFLFGFDSGSAQALAILLGIAVLVFAATTESRVGLSPMVPLRLHAVLDVVLAAALVAAPFVLGFSDEGSPTAFFIVVGVAHLLLTIATQFLPERDTVARR